MVLRWLNAGTSARYIQFTGDSNRSRVNRGSQGGTKYGKTINTGRRGNIAPRNFFRTLGDRALGRMRDNLAKAIEEEMAKLLPHD
jgi:hypothetical protein